MINSRTEDVLLPNGRMHGAEAWDERHRRAWLAFKRWLGEETSLFRNPVSVAVIGSVDERDVRVEIEVLRGKLVRITVPATSLTPESVERLRKRHDWEEKSEATSDRADGHEMRIVDYSCTRPRAFGAGVVADTTELFEEVFRVPHPNGLVAEIRD